MPARAPVFFRSNFSISADFALLTALGAFCCCALYAQQRGVADSGTQENPFVMNGARRGALGAGAFGDFRPPPPPGSKFTPSRFFYTHISMPNFFLRAPWRVHHHHHIIIVHGELDGGGGLVLNGLVSGSLVARGAGARRSRAPPPPPPRAASAAAAAFAAVWRSV